MEEAHQAHCAVEPWVTYGIIIHFCWLLGSESLNHCNSSWWKPGCCSSVPTNIMRWLWVVFFFYSCSSSGSTSESHRIPSQSLVESSCFLGRGRKITKYKNQYRPVENPKLQLYLPLMDGDGPSSPLQAMMRWSMAVLLEGTAKHCQTKRRLRSTKKNWAAAACCQSGVSACFTTAKHVPSIKPRALCTGGQGALQWSNQTKTDQNIQIHLQITAFPASHVGLQESICCESVFGDH